MIKLNDGIYVVVNGQEYKLEYVTPFDDLTKCGQCDFMKQGRCTATKDCLKIEVEFPDSFWKKVMPIAVKTDSTYSKSAYCYNDSFKKEVTITQNSTLLENETVTTDRFVGEFNCE